MEDAQQLVDRYSGTGEPKLNGNGNWTHKEFVTADHLVGESVNPETGIATPSYTLPESLFLIFIVPETSSFQQAYSRRRLFSFFVS